MPLDRQDQERRYEHPRLRAAPEHRGRLPPAPISGGEGAGSGAVKSVTQAAGPGLVTEAERRSPE